LAYAEYTSVVWVTAQLPTQQQQKQMRRFGGGRRVCPRGKGGDLVTPIAAEAVARVAGWLLLGLCIHP
jgi:hypothetical protein